MYAVKCLRSRDKGEFDQEVEALRRFRNHGDPHLIKLLATYYDGEFYNLIFPCADGNLRDYWEQNPKPEKTHSTILWIVKQCLGIAQALRKIHSGDFQGRRGLSLQATGKRGRHGDVKPENILWFPSESGTGTNDPGVLVLSDFGIARFHHTETMHRIYHRNLAASLTYRAPECDLKTDISPSWDIWTLGCVYLEFLTWYLQGWDTVDKFSKQRKKHDLEPDVPEDKYFLLDKRAEFGAYRKSPVIQVRRKP